MSETKWSIRGQLVVDVHIRTGGLFPGPVYPHVPLRKLCPPISVLPEYVTVVISCM